MMEAKDIFTNTTYTKGSTDFHAAVPQQRSDGRSGGVPLRIITPSMRKPPVLVTKVAEPSQGTPGTAISAIHTQPGPALPRPQRGDDGAEQPPTNLWKAFFKRVQTNVTRRHAQFRRHCLALLHSHTAQTARLALGYTRLIAFIIQLSRGELFRKTVMPNGAKAAVAHDRIGALFRRRAVG